MSLTLLTAKIDLGTYGISDRQVLGVFDDEEEIASAIRMANKKWSQNTVIFHSEVISLNRFLIV